MDQYKIASGVVLTRESLYHLVKKFNRLLGPRGGFQTGRAVKFMLGV